MRARFRPNWLASTPEVAGAGGGAVGDSSALVDCAAAPAASPITKSADEMVNLVRMWNQTAHGHVRPSPDYRSILRARPSNWPRSRLMRGRATTRRRG